MQIGRWMRRAPMPSARRHSKNIHLAARTGQAVRQGLADAGRAPTSFPCSGRFNYGLNTCWRRAPSPPLLFGFVGAPTVAALLHSSRSTDGKLERKLHAADQGACVYTRGQERGKKEKKFKKLLCSALRLFFCVRSDLRPPLLSSLSLSLSPNFANKSDCAGRPIDKQTWQGLRVSRRG